jgi:hypothetical protein
VQNTPAGRTLRSGPPDGRGAAALLPPGTSTGGDFGASADGSVIAYTASVSASAGSATSSSWVSDHGVARQVDVPAVSNGVVTAWTVRPDGRSAYAAVGDSVVRYDVATHSATTLCTACFVPRASAGGGGVRLAVSADEHTVAVTQIAEPSFYGGPVDVDLTVVDVASGRALWDKRTQGPAVAYGWTFADDDTLITTVASAQSQVNPEIHRVTGFRSSHLTDIATGVHGYGPFSYVDGVWWYARDSATKPLVSTLFVNPDLTPSGERLLALRSDGPDSSSYTPIATVPGPISMPTASSS